MHWAASLWCLNDTSGASPNTLPGASPNASSDALIRRLAYLEEERRRAEEEEWRRKEEEMAILRRIAVLEVPASCSCMAWLVP